MALVGVDAVCLVLGVSAAGLLRLVLDGILQVASPDRQLVASALLIPVLMLLLRAQGLYDLDHILVGTREYARIAHAVTYGVLIALSVSYFAGGGPLISRSWLALVWVLSVGCVGGGRFVARRIVRQLRRRGVFRARVLIVGASTLGVAIAEQLGAAQDEGLDVVGFLDEFLPLGQPLVGGLSVLGRPSELVSGRAIHLAEECILVPSGLPSQRLEEISRLMVSRGGPVLRLAVNPGYLLTNGLLVVERGSVPLVTLRRARIGGLEAAFKCALDRVGATLALALLAPVLLAVLIQSWLAGGRSFLCRYTIHATAGKSTLRLLRPGVADWLPIRGAPALLAVVAGQLSLVGPRPTIWHTNEPMPPALWLTSVKPGLTGPWRLSGPDAPLAVQAMQDLTYVRNYTIWEDVHILWETARRLCGRGSGLAPLLGRWREHDSDPGLWGLRSELPAAGAQNGTSRG